jgi:L-aspartate oxidase
MWEHCGIEREEESLKEGLEKLLDWLKDWKEWERTPQNRQLFDISLTALATLWASLQRRESRGCHYRKDYPYQRDQFERDSIIHLSELNFFQ